MNVGNYMQINSTIENKERLNDVISGIPYGACVVFDWDNTLKVYNVENRTITSRVDKVILSRLKKDKHCELFIISAIPPRRISLETLLLEVDKLGLEQFFADRHDPVEIRPGKFARKGNIIACGYDKAETFLEVMKESGAKYTVDNDIEIDGEAAGGKDDVDESDCADGFGKGISEVTVAGTMLHGLRQSVDCENKRHVVFFDDEEVNIKNFQALVDGSFCFLVK